MRISIVTICRNAEETVQATVRSVLSQSYSDIEYVIIDGASTDNTLDVVRKEAASFPHRRVDIRSAPDAGLYDALNKGIALANGDVVGLLHADDLYHDADVVQTVADALAASLADIAYGDLSMVRRDDVSQVARFWRAGAFSVGKLRWGWMPPHPTLFLTRTAYNGLRREDGTIFDTTLKIAADYDLILRAFASFPESVVYIPQVLITMRLGGVSTGSFGALLRKSREDLRVIRERRIGGIGTLLCKNLRKLPQLIDRRTARKKQK